MGEKPKPGIWRGDPPATEVVIQKLLEESRLQLPEAYLDQLRQSNGGEGDLAVEPGWVSFWPAEEVVALNKGYEVEQNVPGYFGFASNGGGEMLAFKVQEGEPWPIFMIPFPLDGEYAMMVARDFTSFKQAIGYAQDDDEQSLPES